MSEISTAEARKTLADLINRVAYGKERVVLTRHGKQVCALVPIEDLSLLDRVRSAADRRDLADALAEDADGAVVEWSALKRSMGLEG
jgi:prevent-host-death family protein